MKPQPQPQVPTVDTRGIREIVLSIEALVNQDRAAVPDEAKREPIIRDFAAHLSQEAIEAIDMVLSDCRAKGRSIGYRDLIAEACGLAPDCGLYPSGATNASIRNLLAERAGIKVKWSGPT